MNEDEAVDDDFSSNCLFLCYFFASFTLTRFNRTARGGTFTFGLYIRCDFAYFCIYSSLVSGAHCNLAFVWVLESPAMAWLLMKADEGENMTAAKHSGHFSLPVC